MLPYAPRAILSSVLAVALCGALLTTPAARADAGRFEAVLGQVEVLRADGTTVPAKAGDVVSEGDSIRTGGDGRADLSMRDDARLSVRPNTRLKFDAYRFDAKDEPSGRSVIALVRGALRSITGAIGRTNRDSYRINTPSATIGIRGTDHESAFVPKDDPDFPGIEPGTYDRVFAGGTFIEAASQRLDLAADEAGFAGLDPKQAPIRLRDVPAFLRGDSLARESAGTTPDAPRDREKTREKHRAKDNERKDAQESKRDRDGTRSDRRPRDD